MKHICTFMKLLRVFNIHAPLTITSHSEHKQASLVVTTQMEMIFSLSLIVLLRVSQ